MFENTDALLLLVMKRKDLRRTHPVKIPVALFVWAAEILQTSVCTHHVENAKHGGLVPEEDTQTDKKPKPAKLWCTNHVKNA